MRWCVHEPVHVRVCEMRQRDISQYRAAGIQRERAVKCNKMDSWTAGSMLGSQRLCVCACVCAGPCACVRVCAHPHMHMLMSDDNLLFWLKLKNTECQTKRPQTEGLFSFLNQCSTVSSHSVSSIANFENCFTNSICDRSL